jgi:uncharacterized membrane protein
MSEDNKAALERFLPEAARAQVVAAIHAAESRTSGEIKVHIETHCPDKLSAYDRALALFAQLGLEKTRERNAVLLYVASEHRRFAILGDSGIHAEVGDAYWAAAAKTLSAHFARGAVADGLVAAVSAIGDRLAARFPNTEGARKDNQLSDDISIGDDAKR